MFNSRAVVDTPGAAVYLRKLCIHWEQRFNVEYDSTSGTIDFGGGECARLLATTGSLDISVFAPDEKAGKSLEHIVAEHIVRFARKESLLFEWRRVD